MNVLKSRVKLGVIAVFSIVLLMGTFLIERVIYPLSPYKEQIIVTAKKYDVEPALLFSIVKTESGFKKNAVSIKGAVGLMQISPETAEYAAQMMGLADYDLTDPLTNLEIGCYYFKYLERKFSTLNESLSAYNAGEGNVKRWLSDGNLSDDGRTLKRIPIKETAEYVKKVNKSLVKYKKLYFNILDKR